MIATKRLTSDHKAFLKLLDKMEACLQSAKPSVASFGATFRLLLTPLKLHARLEEDFLFSPLDEGAASGGATLPGRLLTEEHRELDRRIDDIQGALAGPEVDLDVLRNRTTLFCDRLRRHIYMEDTLAFPLAESVLGEERLEKMAKDMDLRVRQSCQGAA